MGDWEELLARLEELVGEVDELDESVHEPVLELLDGIDTIHRRALGHLGELLDAETLERLRRSDPAVGWLLDTYAVGIDEAAAAEAALEAVRPYVHSHGGRVELLDATGGVVRLRMAGSCAGCTASAITLREGVERTLREGFPGFARLEVEEDTGEAHPPPGPTLLEIQPFRGSPGNA